MSDTTLPTAIGGSPDLDAADHMFYQVASQARTLRDLMTFAVEALGDVKQPDVNLAIALCVAAREVAERIGGVAALGGPARKSGAHPELLEWLLDPAACGAWRKARNSGAAQ